MPTVRFFAGIKDVVQMDRTTVDATDVRSLLEVLKGRFGEEFTSALGSTKVAVNGRFIDHLDGVETVLMESDEVALLPPVSGG